MRLLYQVLELTTRHEFNIARAAAPARRRNVWVRLIDDEGVEGWGEAAPNAYYGESAESTIAALEAMRQRLAAWCPATQSAAGTDQDQTAFAETAGPQEAAGPKQWNSTEAAAREEDLLRDLPAAVTAIGILERELQQIVPRAAAARAAVSAALFDCLGKREQRPVHELLKLDPARAPVSSFTIGIDSIDLMRERVRAARSYPILKVKVGTPDDESILSMMREERPEVTIRVDANTGWTREQALRNLPMLAEFGVELIEQPLAADDIDGLAQLRAASVIPVIADESCKTVDDVYRLVGCVDGVNIKLAKCGSLLEAMRMAAVAHGHNMRVMIGCMIESTLGIAAGIHLAPLADFLDLDGAALLAQDPFGGPHIHADGRLAFNGVPGLGVRVAP